VGHAATFAVNAALVASQWQRRAFSLSFRRTNPEQEAGQTTNIDFGVFDSSGIDLSLSDLMFNPLYHLTAYVATFY